MTMERKDPVFHDTSVELKEACGLSWEELQSQLDAPDPNKVMSATMTEVTTEEPEIIRNPLTESEMMFIVDAISPAIEARVEEIVARVVQDAMMQTKMHLDQTLKLHVRDAIMSTLKRVDISED